jgi:arylsulfate sulfotransferase
MVATALLVTITSAQGLAYELVPDLAGPQPLGTTVTWEVRGEQGDPTDRIDYRLAVRRVGSGEPARMVYDLAVRNRMAWTPMTEGEYQVTAQVRNRDTRELTTLRARYQVEPRVALAPEVFATNNPLVALYSAPACAPGNTLEVSFGVAADGALQTTDRKPCRANLTVNVLVAGMRGGTVYGMREVVRDAAGSVVRLGPRLSFTTGSAPEDLPVVTVTIPPAPGASLQDDILLAGPTATLGSTVFATDLEGNVVWFYERPDDSAVQLMRPMAGGNIMLLPLGETHDRAQLREVDLAGNTVRQTTGRRISEQLKRRGMRPMSVIHHEIRELDNGHIVLLGSVERLVEGVQGEGLVDIVSDVIVALDQNMQVVWASDLWDVLDPTREALLGEVCVPNGPGCPLLFLAEEANDWTHSNAVGYSPADGNLIISSRHQDWVIKLDYRDGSGTGGLVWRLGREGDFTLAGTPRDRWFSHQHDSNYVSDNRVLVYDNGNANPGCQDLGLCGSWARAYDLDEATMTATLAYEAYLEQFSFAVGSAQPLSNGNYHSNSGIYDGGQTARAQETDAQGNVVFELEVGLRSYRSFRMQNMYTPPDYY